jgi:large subunit ribosomal protein L24
MNTLHVKKGDVVIVLSGKDKGKKGKVITALPREDKVIVEGVNMATRHKKPRRRTDPGGILHQETPIRACKVMHVCPKCGKPTRRSVEILSDGTRQRRCKHCKEPV